MNDFRFKDETEHRFTISKPTDSDPILIFVQNV